MAITIRLGKEEERKLRGACESDGDLRHGLHRIAGAVRSVFGDVESPVRLESEDGVLLAEEGSGDAGTPMSEVAAKNSKELAAIEAMPREAGMAFGCLAGKGDPDPSLRELPFRRQVTLASERAAARRELRQVRKTERGFEQ